jgi:hypothetical protein
MKKIDEFIKNPTQEGFEKLDIVGDVKSMNYLYKKAPHLAIRYLKSEDWVEMARFEKSFSERTQLLRHAISSISSFEDCLRVFDEDRRDEFFEDIKEKAILYCISFDDIIATICEFELAEDERLYRKYGKKLILRAIELMATMEDFDLLSSIIPMNDSKTREKYYEKATSLGLPELDELV